MHEYAVKKSAATLKALAGGLVELSLASASEPHRATRTLLKLTPSTTLADGTYIAANEQLMLRFQRRVCCRTSL